MPTSPRKAPAVSIVMPSRNHGRYIESAIGSLLGQTFADFELLVLDYASTDQTWDILKACKDPRLVALDYPHPGMGKALNHGFSLARGRYLTWFHTDNWAYDDYLAVLVGELEADSGADFVYSDFEWIDASGRVKDLVRYGPFTPDSLLAYCLVGPTFLYRRRVYELVGDYLESHPRDDHDYWLRAWHTGVRFRNVPRNLGKCREHEQSRMTTMRAQYDSSVTDLIADNIHVAQERGVELFRVRDRDPAEIEAFARAHGRLVRRVGYFLNFFVHQRPGLGLAVLGQGPVQGVVAEILARKGFAPAWLDETGQGPEWPGVERLTPEAFLNRGLDFVLVCSHDPGDAILARLTGLGLPRRGIVRLFLEPEQGLA